MRDTDKAIFHQTRNSVNNRHHSWIRPAVQFGFILFSILLGIEFSGFVNSLQQMTGPVEHRPPAVEAYLPISSLMSLSYFCKTGIANEVHPAGLVIFSVTLILAITVRRGFCSWVCPIGTAEEYLWKTGRKLFGGNLNPPQWIDLPLRSLKYVLLAFFLYHILLMPLDEFRQFIYGPYNRIADIKMYHFFSHISMTTTVVLLILAVLSILIKNFWCRYLCPYGALLGLLSLFSPVAVRRQEDKCTGCGKCTRACPNQIPVDRRIAVRSTRCTACFSCINSCHVSRALHFGTNKTFKLSLAGYALITVLAFFFAAQTAKSAGYWYTSTPPELYKNLYEQISQIDHPR